MTDALQKEAREAADDWMETLPESGDLGNTETHVDDAYEAGYLAAAEPREKEIASLRAKLEAVPVKEIQRASWWHGAGGRIKDALAIDRWLAGMK